MNNLINLNNYIHKSLISGTKNISNYKKSLLKDLQGLKMFPKLDN